LIKTIDKAFKKIGVKRLTAQLHLGVVV